MRVLFMRELRLANKWCAMLDQQSCNQQASWLPLNCLM